MGGGADAQTPSLAVDVRGSLDTAVERGDIRAAVVGLYRNGDDALFAFGRSGPDVAAAPDGDTVFEIGSVTKVFTALLVQALADAGRLTWDDPVGKFLPDVEFASEAVAAVTLRELASHTSGLPRLPDNLAMDDPLDPYAGYEPAQLVEFLGRFDPDDLAKSYEYSNLGAGLLGYVASRAANRSFADAMTAEVLSPLGLDDTAVGLPDELAARIAPGYSQGAEMPNWSGFDALAGAGALVSTASDMLRFLRSNLAPDAPDFVLGVRKPQAGGETALGWHLQEIADEDVVYWHTGGTGGYASFLGIRPATGEGVVILTTSTAYAELSDMGFAQIGAREAAADAGDLSRYPGRYRLAEGFILSIYEKNGRLYGQATGQAEFLLSAAGRDEFVFDAADIRIAFEDQGDGPASGLMLHQSGNATKAPRIGDVERPAMRAPVDIDPAVLPDYEGRYRLTGDIEIRVLVRGSQLYAQVTGQAAYPVFPAGRDRFFYKVVDAELEFERTDAGDVVAVTLHQGGEQRASRID